MAPFHVGDPSFGDEAPDVPLADAEERRQRLDVDELGKPQLSCLVRHCPRSSFSACSVE
jgi:hypothetical protein